MANPSPTRLSPAELRKRLLAPPADPAVSTTTEEAAPVPVPRVPSRNGATRYGNTATQAAIDLDSLIADVGPIANPRLTPLPDTRLEPMQYRAMPQQPEPVPMQYRPMPQQDPMYGPMSPSTQAAHYENQQLRAQNAELHRIVEEMKPVLEEASASEQRFVEKETAYKAKLTEQDGQIAELQASVKKLEEQLAAVPPPRVPKTRDELEEWADELEKDSARITQERKRIDEDRRQLRDDEESLENQMRQMEVAMARERAMIARQETELKRLSSEIQHELEVLQRGDGTLREQLSKFQRKHQEVVSHTGGSAAPPYAPTHVSPPEPIAPPAKPKDSGLLRRIFRGGK
jgi:hypothetical protein